VAVDGDLPDHDQGRDERNGTKPDQRVQIPAPLCFFDFGSLLLRRIKVAFSGLRVLARSKARDNGTLAVAQGDRSATLPGRFDIAGKYHRGLKGLNSGKQLGQK
jgi:hypothetical protein